MYYWPAGASGLKSRFFVHRASAHASILRARDIIHHNGRENVVPVKLLRRGSSERLVEVLPLSHSRKRRRLCPLFHSRAREPQEVT